MLRSGTQRTLAWVSSASATQTRAWAAATISGRASERRSAVARLIGNRRSVASSGAALILGVKERGDEDGAVAPELVAPFPGMAVAPDVPSGKAAGMLATVGPPVKPAAGGEVGGDTAGEDG